LATVDEKWLAETDVRAIVRLLGETLGHPGTDLDRKRFLLTGLARLVDADIWVWIAQKGGPDPSDVTYFTMIDGGWASDRQRGIATGATWSEDSQPFNALMSRNAIYAYTRSEVYADDEWYATELFKRFREPAGLDDVMGTGVRIREDILSAIGFHRSLGRPRFSERDRRIALVVTTEVEWLHRTGIPDIDATPVDRLSPRLRHIMLLLLSHSSRKQIASELAISAHTVNEYVAEVYARLGVRSRAELMARFIEGKRSTGQTGG